MGVLFRITGFTPFILIVFFNAFVDLGHKIIVQNTVFKIYDEQAQVILTAIVNSLILLPFILLFTPAGWLSDRYYKPRVIQTSAMVAVILTLFITASYYAGWFELAFGLTFLLAVQSAFYSPSKYGYIRELVGKSRLATANGAVQACTIIAILSGIFFFSILFEWALAGKTYETEADIMQIIAPVGWVLVACSLIELFTAYRLPIQSTSKQSTTFNWKSYRSGQSLKNNLRMLRGHSGIWLSIIGLSVFWSISQVVLATFPAFAKENLAMTNTVVVQGLLACAGIGIILGSLLASKASSRYIETGLIPIGALGMVITLTLLPQLSYTPYLALDIIFFGLFGGLFIIPLNAMIQFDAKEDQLGTVLAGNNWVQNVVMFSFLVLTVALSLLDVSSTTLLNMLIFVALIGMGYTVFKLPQSLVRYVIKLAFYGKYRVNVQGFNNIPSQGAVLMLGNHISWLDWVMVQIASPRPIRFVMHRTIYQHWYLKWFLDLFGVIPITSGRSKEALVEINKSLRQGEVVCLFPEGMISRNGQLGEFKRGFERCVNEVDGVILPFYLRGLWGSRFSHSSERMRELRQNGLRRDVIVAFAEPLPISTRADALKRTVFDLSIVAWQHYTDTLDPIPLAWMRSVKQSGSRFCITDAINGTKLSRRSALASSITLARRIKKLSPEQNIALLIPTSSAGIVVNMGALLQGKTVVNLNFTTDIQTLETVIRKAEVQTIYTSRHFMKNLEQQEINLSNLLKRVQIVYLEELYGEISHIERGLTLAAVALLPARVLYRLFGKPVTIKQTAAILFSNDNKGELKGVMLSHQNIMGNIKQLSDVLNTRGQDGVMATLPLFHAFGLTVTGFMPLVEGIPMVCHPNPTDVRNIAKAIYKHQLTLFCGTSTLLHLFVSNHRVHPLMLESLRIIVAGGEPLKPEVRHDFSMKFGKTIYEGYGTTETTPVASVNIPDILDPSDWRVQTGNKPGTVGMPLPGSSFRVVDPHSMETRPTGEDGLILIGGTQVMKGYLDDNQRTQDVIVELDGQRWYKTGDKGHLDRDGFLTIIH